MVFIPPTHVLHQKSGKPASQHDTTVGMLVVALIMLGIALSIFILGPRSNNPPPIGVGLAVSGLAFLFGLIGFFSWMKEQGDGETPTDDGHTADREQ